MNCLNHMNCVYYIWFLAAPGSWRRHKELKKAVPPSKSGRRHKELWKSCQGNLCTWAHVPEPSPKPRYPSLCSCIVCPWLSRDLAALHEAVTRMDEAVMSLNGGWHFMQWCRMNGYDLNWMRSTDSWTGFEPFWTRFEPFWMDWCRKKQHGQQHSTLC